MIPSTLPPFADQRVLRGAPATLNARFRDQYGEARAANTVTVKVEDVNGSTVLADTTASYDSTNVRYSVDLSASDVADLGLFTATWTSTTGSETVQTFVEVVSGYYFSVADARAWKSGELADQTKYTDAQVRATRDEVEREFERICWPFVPRYRQVTVCATNGRMYLPDMHVREVLSVVELGSGGDVVYTWTADEVAALIADVSGEIVSRRASWWPHTVYRVEYTYGFERPPADVVNAALLRLRYLMNQTRSGIPERALSYTASEGGTYSYAVAGRANFVTGQPDVDLVLNDPRYRRPLVGVG